jgi:hypothetical protein
MLHSYGSAESLQDVNYSSATCGLPACMIYDMVYLLTAVGLSPGGSTHLHTNNT